MASVTLGLSLPKDELPRLDHLVEHFAQGNRSAFLRLAMHHMEVVEHAQRLDALAAYGAERLAAKGLRAEDIPLLVKRVLSTPELS